MEDVFITDRKPRESLAPLVIRYSHLRVERDGGFRIHVVTDAGSHLIYPLGAPIEFQSDKGFERVENPILIGPYERPIRIKAMKGTEFLLVELARFSIRDLFGCPADRYANTWVTLMETARGALADIPGLAASRLTDAPENRDDPRPSLVETIFSMIDQALADLAERARAAGRAEIAADRAIVERLWDSDPGLTVTELASRHGWTRRRMVAAALAVAGFTPKVLRRIARAAALRERVLESADGTDLAGLAVDCGYADQAHAVRDLSHYAGFTPALLKRKFPGFREGWLRTRTRDGQKA